jgi:endonuclease-3
MPPSARFDIHSAVAYLRETLRTWRSPYLSQERVKSDPFRTLIGCVLSLRTKDECTAVAAERLFTHADTPQAMLKLREQRIAKLIFPVGFYNQKARQIMGICRLLLDEHNGRVPDEIDELVTLPGVGRKTANLVVTEAFGKPGICVDTHVHRISNRWGYVRTPSPDKTETALRAKLPEEYWLEINRLLVAYGKRICTPVSPKCSECGLEAMCAQRGVGRRR